MSNLTLLKNKAAAYDTLITLLKKQKQELNTQINQHIKTEIQQLIKQYPKEILITFQSDTYKVKNDSQHIVFFSSTFEFFVFAANRWQWNKLVYQDYNITWFIESLEKSE